MRDVTVSYSGQIEIGRVGENQAVRVVWPELLGEWSQLYGNGTVQLAVRRPQDETPYPAVCTVEDGTIAWVVAAADVAQAGIGECELSYLVDGVVAKSQTWKTVIRKSLTGADMAEPPDAPAKAWYSNVQDQIGNLSDLETENKSSLVGAVNEVKKKAETGGDAVKYIEQTLTSAQQEQARGNIDADQSTYIISVTKDTDGNYSFAGNHATLKDVAIMSKAGRRCILIVNTAERQKLTYTLAEVLWETGEYNVTLANFVASYPYNRNPVMDVITWTAQGDTLTNTNILIPIDQIEGFMQSAINPLMVYRGSYNYWYINGGSIWYTQIVASPASYPVLYVQDEYGNLPLYLSEITDTEVLYKNIASDGSWVGFKVSASGSAPSQSGLISGSGSGGDISLGLSGVAAGQLLRVKTINNNGNPTAWETVNVSTEVSNSSTNDELASAKAVYDAITTAIGSIDTLVGTGEVTT